MTAKKDGGKCMLNTRVGLGQSEVVDVLMSAWRTRRRVNTGTCERRGMRVVKMSSTDGCTVSAGRERAGLRRRAFLSADGLAVWGASGRGADLAGSRGGGTCQLGGPRWAGRGTHRGVGLAGARGSGEGDREGRGPVGGLEAAGRTAPVDDLGPRGLRRARRWRGSDFGWLGRLLAELRSVGRAEGGERSSGARICWA